MNPLSRRTESIAYHLNAKLDKTTAGKLNKILSSLKSSIMNFRMLLDKKISGNRVINDDGFLT